MRGKEDETHQLNGSIKWEADTATRGIVSVKFLGHVTSPSCVIPIGSLNTGNEDPETYV